MDLSFITNKLPHYKSRETLQAEHNRTLPFMEQFMAAMYSDISVINATGWTFVVFWIRDDRRIIHCGLYSCCKDESGPQEIRQDIEEKIFRRLPYDRIVWEI